MPLVALQDVINPWGDVKDAAHILWRASTIPDISALRSFFQTHYSDPALTVVELHKGFNNSRRGLVVCSKDRITIAFEGSHPDELIKNLWTDAKGSNWWDLPYPVYSEGNRVHSFFRDMWRAMQRTVLDALDDAVRMLVARGEEPAQITVTGFSMGGGVSILAFTDIVEHIRSSHGSASSSPQRWAVDSELGSLVGHFTFAAVAAADRGYYTILNQLYERHHIRAWDFMNHRDITVHVHFFAFRSWLGHRYILPEAVVGQFSEEFGPQGHWMLGYLKAAEWAAGNRTDMISSAYQY